MAKDYNILMIEEENNKLFNEVEDLKRKNEILINTINKLTKDNSNSYIIST